MKRIVIELTENEAETLTDSIGAYIEQTHLALGRCLGETAKELETINAIRLRILGELKFGKRQSVIEWHKYPDEKPERKGYYYIKLKDDPRVLSVLTYDGEFSFSVEYWAKPPKFPSED